MVAVCVFQQDDVEAAVKVTTTEIAGDELRDESQKHDNNDDDVDDDDAAW